MATIGIKELRDSLTRVLRRVEAGERIEVTRAVKLADLEDDVEPDPDELLAGCSLIDADIAVLRQAAALASRSLRTLDAVHLATAIRVSPDVFVTYDRQLGRAARAAGLHVEAPGAEA
jgi:uncharacterized protein